MAYLLGKVLQMVLDKPRKKGNKPRDWGNGLTGHDCRIEEVAWLISDRQSANRMALSVCPGRISRLTAATSSTLIEVVVKFRMRPTSAGSVPTIGISSIVAGKVIGIVAQLEDVMNSMSAND